MTLEATAWDSKTEQTTIRITIDEVQILTCLCITKGMRTVLHGVKAHYRLDTFT